MLHGHSVWVQTVMEAYEAKLLRYAADIVGRSLARDVVQDTFLKLCRAERARVEPRLSAWLYTVCRNGALEFKRKVRRLSVLDEDAHETTGSAPGADLEREQLVAQVKVCVEGLSEQQRELLRLRFDGELSYKEIAAITGLSVSNVGFILHTALARVRGALEHQGQLATSGASRRSR